MKFLKKRYFFAMIIKYSVATALLVFASIKMLSAEPIVLKGGMLKDLCGKTIESIRLCNSRQEPIPFQIDELTSNGNYICPDGSSPNSDSSNGILDPMDEVVFLSEDCIDAGDSHLLHNTINRTYYPIKIQSNPASLVYITNDTSILISKQKYIEYDTVKQLVKTPFYYAQFGKDRFHFTKAGIFDSETERYVDLTSELAVTIYLRALWGLIPIHYTEENLVCIVARYKTGPVRLIRGGNFHLNLGLGIKGSHAYVNQLCYPQMVKVPVKLHVPIRFRSFFSEAYIEMCPVVKKKDKFQFKVPEIHETEMLSSDKPLDTMIEVNPNNRFFAVTNGNIGYGWILQALIENRYLGGSCFVFRRPSVREQNSADCGYKMMIRDLPKGIYEINNWVLFSKTSYSYLTKLSSTIQYPTKIDTPWGEFVNQIGINPIVTVNMKKKR
jgi:hypothetical protein